MTKDELYQAAVDRLGKEVNGESIDCELLNILTQLLSILVQS